jgi:putative FmdB family regulatory protein
MPKYVFECPTCEIRFERNLKVGNHPTHKCPECKELAPLIIPKFGFSFEKGKNATANSGVHDHDYPTADKVVGRSADKRWGYIHARDKVKEEVRKISGTAPLLRRAGKDYVEYSAISGVEKKAREKLVDKAVTAYRK